jgi:multicomponent Na+:H+ antiporter subunit E
MTAFAFNLLLALIWTALTGRLDLVNLALGFGLGALALYLSRPAWSERYFRRALRLISLMAWCLGEILISALSAVAVSFGLRRASDYGLLEIPIRAERDQEIALLSAMISISPGALAVGMSPDRRRLIVHAPLKSHRAITQRVQRILEPLIIEGLT